VKTKQNEDYKPITTEEFSDLMLSVPNAVGIKKMAIAVSGGGDSMALSVLLKEWCDGQEIDLYALTVDHALRTNSVTEAKAVQETLQKKGINHKILTWEHDGKINSSIQEAARKNRYDLLLGECRVLGIHHLALAHNVEDQAETFLHRLAKGSGVAGLSAMALVRQLGDISLIRPVLGISHDRLLSTCRAQNIKWVEDPSNADTKYARVRLRKARDVLAQEGLTVDRIYRMTKKYARTREYLEQQTKKAQQNCVISAEQKKMTLDRKKWMSFHPEISLLILNNILMDISGQNYPPRSRATEALYDKLCQQGFSGATLHGCYLSVLGDDILIMLENR
jgi:tRNA(Ile)-lysidine synthase